MSDQFEVCDLIEILTIHFSAVFLHRLVPVFFVPFLTNLISLSPSKFPEFYSFPPFFTIQPNLTTREKQLGLWRELILGYHTNLKIKSLIVHDCPLWKNTVIGRELSHEDVKKVMIDFVKR